MRTLRPTAVLVLVSTLLAACAPSDEDLARSGAALSQAFSEASARWAVPEPLLKGIAWEETRFFHPESRSLVGGWGVMQLREGASLDEAASLTGTPVEVLKSDPTANIEGAAAVLRARADWYFAEYPSRDPDRLEDWFEVVKHASGLDSAELAEGYALGVFGTLQKGARRVFPDGAAVEIAPQAVDVEDELVFDRDWSYLRPDYPSATWRAADSSNYSTGGITPRYVVVHTVQGSYWGCISWFQNPAANASTHYVVSKGGDVTQMVEHKNKAWHVRCHNGEAIGIEHEGWVSDSSSYTESMYRASAALTRWIADKHGIPKTRSRIVGHGDPAMADCNTHTDPGSYWNWDYYMSLVTGGGSSSTGVLKGAVFWGTNFDTDKTDLSKRIAGATVKLNTGKTTTTDSEGWYTFNVAAGTYTVTASKTGYSTESAQKTVTAGTTSWGSIMLTKAGAAKGTVKGVVFWGDQPSDYDANVQDASKRLANATVTFSPGGRTATTGADGWYEIQLDPGTYEVHAAAAGYVDGDRPDPVTVSADAISWGSVMVLKPASTADETPPSISISAPADGATVDLPEIQVVGTVSDQSSIDVLTVNGTDTPLTNGGFSTTVALTAGSNTIEVRAVDAAGNEGTASVTVDYAAEASGVDGFVYDAAEGETVRIEGALVNVAAGDGVQATTDPTGAFSVDVPGGTFPVTVSAAGYKTWVGSVEVIDGSRAQLAVALELGSDPQGGGVEITFPADGAEVLEPEVVVSGYTSVTGFERITVNGAEAALDAELGSAFTAVVSLAEGDNLVEVEVLGPAGDVMASTSITVRYVATGCGCSSSSGGAGGALMLLLGLALLGRRRRR